ncbi:hypothetical protein Taro_037505 [Colocasia esculenta]|uniref:Uncharacterized protein n=1 Tax=Colocasia esculenta TaxID=4460 RepID=A0A843WJH6_COLES|nr:hypothetical protein [Colocasia esculenta]
MKVKRESSRLVKPFYEGVHSPPTTLTAPLTVFDTVTFNSHVAVIYAYRPPTPPNSKVEKGLARALSEYREWAGRLCRDPDHGRPAILLNDAGALFVEASVDCTLDKALPFRPSPALLSLHPDLHGVDDHLVQVQLTRFKCGSLVVGFTAHHMVADGHATSSFLVAWGNATRGVPMDPLPLHGRSAFLSPRDPPRVEFEHRGVEFMKAPNKKNLPSLQLLNGGVHDGAEEEEEEGVRLVVGEREDVIVHKAHFTVDFLAKLKASASSSPGVRGNIAAVPVNGRPFSTFECLVAHLWRTTTRARELGGQETTQVRISVNGRGRLAPQVPADYFGNLVLWAFPRAKVWELLGQPLGHAAGLIRDAVSRVNNAYFRSFVDFASSGAVEAEGLVPTADMEKMVLYPNLEVDSWLRFPFYEVDFGGGGPYIFMPTYFPVEGMLFLLPSFIGDGSIDAFVPLFQQNLPTFKNLCYALDLF